MNYYKRHLGDYAKKAARLSILQHGVYNLLIDACYDRERFPTKEEAVEWTWACTQDEKDAVDFVLKKFFIESPSGHFEQKRIREAIQEYHVNAATNKRIALEREANRKKNLTNGEQSVHEPSPSFHESPPNHKPITNNQEPQTIITPKPPRGREVDFGVFWAAYPKKVGKDAALRCWMKNKGIPPIENVLAAVRKQVKSQEWQKDGGQFIPHPATWINQGRWDDGGMDYQVLTGRQQRPTSQPAPQGPSLEEKAEQLAQEWWKEHRNGTTPHPYKDWSPELKKEYEDHLAKEMSEAFASLKAS